MRTRRSSSPRLTGAHQARPRSSSPRAELRLLQACVRFSLRYTQDPVLAQQLGHLQVRLDLRSVATAA
jgi:hypothetical protein